MIELSIILAHSVQTIGELIYNSTLYANGTMTVHIMAVKHVLSYCEIAKFSSAWCAPWWMA